MSDSVSDSAFMERAVSLARLGEGFVEPNPMVGCVIVKDGDIVGEGYHKKFGSAHAEIIAIESAKSNSVDLKGATAYVTLEPCCHFGKTPPCTKAMIYEGISRVVIGLPDPYRKVNGEGIQQLKDSGINVDVGILAKDVSELTAPFLKRVRTGKPWIISKWAMSLDGKIATKSGDSRWISSSKSREIVHQIRSRVDGILVGRGTVEADDPMLTARIDDQTQRRIATRIIVDSKANLSTDSRLVQSAKEFPVLLVCEENADSGKIEELRSCDVEVFQCPSANGKIDLGSLFDELGTRKSTNVLVEGGGQIHGTLFENDFVDELHLFIAPKIVGEGISPVGGFAIDKITTAANLQIYFCERIEDDIYVIARRKCQTN